MLKPCQLLPFTVILSMSLIVATFSSCAVEMISGLEATEYAAFAERITAIAGSEEAAGLSLSTEARSIGIAEEAKFFPELQRVKMDPQFYADESPKLYFEKDGQKTYFGEIVIDQQGQQVVYVDGIGNSAVPIEIPSNWKLYRVKGDNVNIMTYGADGSNSIYQLYKLQTGNVVFVVHRVGALYEIQLRKGVTGFVDAAMLVPIITSKHITITHSYEAPATISQQKPVPFNLQPPPPAVPTLSPTDDKWWAGIQPFPQGRTGVEVSGQGFLFTCPISMDNSGFVQADNFMNVWILNENGRMEQLSVGFPFGQIADLKSLFNNGYFLYADGSNSPMYQNGRGAAKYIYQAPYPIRVGKYILPDGQIRYRALFSNFSI